MNSVDYVLKFTSFSLVFWCHENSVFTLESGGLSEVTSPFCDNVSFAGFMGDANMLLIAKACTVVKRIS